MVSFFNGGADDDEPKAGVVRDLKHLIDKEARTHYRESATWFRNSTYVLWKLFVAFLHIFFYRGERRSSGGRGLRR